MSEDIVARLRRHQCISGIRTVIDDAADEIELLRSTVTDCRIEIERLTAERDEARRAWIMFFCNEGLDMDPNARVWPDDPEMLEAARLGWDCFKEAKDGSPDQ